MKKIILDLAVTLDGFIEGPNGEVDWCIMDDDMDFSGFLSTIDTIFYGRVSYDSWGNFQPDEHASAPERELWQNVHSKKKYVFSTQPRRDRNAEIINSDIADTVAKIKNEGGKDIWLYGGASLISTFIHLQLIDIYRLSIHPIVLGTGKPLFENVKDRMALKLLELKSFKSGVVQIIYRNERT